MSIQIGSQLGPYRVLSSVGSGGMGEVYLARDTKLGRDVALKFLSSAIGRDPDKLARFSREAQLLAALNHPNIAAIYGLEESAGQPALVLEYIGGETLAERIERGPIPMPEALRIAVQIAEALEAAHEKGVVHRDLKPANVKITPEEVVKVLDFGLAKAMQSDSAPVLDSSATPTVSLVSGEMILGTPGYMAPEQARGKIADRRADIWAFGVVLFEMLSGRRLVQGETVTDALVQTLERDPDWTQLPSAVPEPLRKLLQWCLKKNARDRLQSIGDARILLQEWIANPSSLKAAVATTESKTWKRFLPWVLAPLLLLIAGLLLRPSPKPVERAVAQLEYAIPNGQALNHNYRHGLDISPDARRFLFVSTARDGQRRIYVRDLDRWDAVEIPGTATQGAQGVQDACFSPDGQSIAFFQAGQLKKVAIGGGAPVVLVERVNPPGAQDFGPEGIAWGVGGNIVYSRILGAGLRLIRESGSDPEEFTTLDEKANEVSHRLPHFLPDGSAVLFTVLRYTTVTPDWTRAQIWAKSLKTGERKLVLENAMDARYAGNGSLVFARQGKLFAIRFDAGKLAVIGSPVPVLDGLTQSLYGINAVAWTGAAQFSISEDGTLLYAGGSVEPPFLANLVWVDRSGRVTPITGAQPRSRFAARVAPDGRRIAFSELYVNKDIWLFDPMRGTEDRASYEGQNAFPTMSATGSLMAFRSDRSGPLRIYLSNENNLRTASAITEGPLDTPSSWTPNGNELAFTRDGNIYAVSASEPHTVRPLLDTAADERYPEVSPNGKWLAYTSNESGRYELYVQPYDGSGRRVTLTSSGAQEPAWSKNSDEIFYLNQGRIFSVRYKVSGAEFVPEKPAVLFDLIPLVQGGGATVRTVYDVSPDGRFLMIQSVPEAAAERNQKVFPSTLRFIFNWTDEVERMIAAAK